MTFLRRLFSRTPKPRAWKVTLTDGPFAPMMSLRERLHERYGIFPPSRGDGRLPVEKEQEKMVTCPRCEALSMGFRRCPNCGEAL